MISRANRFHGHRAISRLRGSVLHSQHFSMRYQKNKINDYRLAVVVSKKVAPKAVTRNRIRRRLFEQVRVQGRVSNLPVDLIIYVKTIDAALMESVDLSNEVASLTKKMLAQLK